MKSSNLTVPIADSSRASVSLAWANLSGNVARVGSVLALLLMAATATSAAESRSDSAQTRVRTTSGWLGGGLADGVIVFRGIPYAAAPVGALRWRAPLPAVNWEGVRPATQFSPDCPQKPLLGPGGSAAHEPSPQLSRGQAENEDCLYLNIWTRAPQPEAHLPVMVWIHGGGYQFGSGAIADYDGTHFAHAGVVLVTINYRLGALGYLVHPELTAESTYHSSGNYGLLDQIAALQWVQQNIAAFGGDPARVTIFGESAGSGSVNILQASPLAKNLFSRAIGESTSQMDSSLGLLGRQSRTQAEEFGARYMDKLGAHTLDEMRKLPVAALTGSPEWFWPLDPDGYLLPESVYDTFRDGHQNDVPILIGSNGAEGINLNVPWIQPATDEEKRDFKTLYPKPHDTQVNTDDVAWQAQVWATLQTQHGHSAARVYRFDHPVPDAQGRPSPPIHGAEILYVFQNFDQERRAWTDADRHIGDRIAAYWVNFARSADPNGPGLPKWPLFRPEMPEIMRFDVQEARAAPAPHQDAYRFIEGYYARRRR